MHKTSFNHTGPTSSKPSSYANPHQSTSPCTTWCSPPPRTMAPALSIATCELVGGQPENAIPSASALHLMHAASVVHQRLPLSDRPNKNTNHHQAFLAGVELLTGDAMSSFGYELLATPSEHHSKPERILRVITHAMGAQGMVEGQYLQMRCSGSGKVRWAVEKKEGGLYGCGAACGAILGGATEEGTERLRGFGRYVGMIHGMMTSMVDDHSGQDEEEVGTVGLSEMVEKLRLLALKELECFNHRPMVEIISSILHC